MRVNRKKLSVAVFHALNAGVMVSLAAPVALAQTPAQTVTQTLTPQRIEKIEVTGSRIPKELAESESPVNVITNQDIRFTGLSSTSDVLNQLPQILPGQGNSIANGASGTATVDIRGLGAVRTLVLIDGKRVPAGSPTSWPTNINAIPSTLIQRVELFSGGASAVYGSDALAGVVNFIMNDHFEGVQFDYNLQGYNHQQGSFVADIIRPRAVTNPAQFQVPGNVGWDGTTQNFSVTAGSNFADGKGNATIYFDYNHIDPVLQAKRDYTACALRPEKNGTYTCGGSSTSYPGRFTDFSNFNITIADAAGNVRPFRSALDQYNFAPTNYLQRPDERYTFNAFMHYDVTPQIRAYAEFDFMDDHTVAQIAPSGSFLQFFTFKDENPLLSQAFKDATGIAPGNPVGMYIGRRNVEGGGRQDDIRLTNYRIVMGAKGSVLDDKWDYDVWWQSGKNILQRTYKNDFSTARTARAFDVVKDPLTGKSVCASFLDGSDLSCVPWDIFHIGGVTPAALAYLQTPGFQNGYTSQTVVGGTLRSDLGQYGWRTPWAREGVGFAVGYEYRSDALSQSVDAEFDTGDLAGQGGATHGVTGQISVNEFYAEARVPIAQRMPWIWDLSVSGAYRYSDYSTGITTNTYGIGADWAPIKEVKLRGSYQQAIRAANIIEQFTPQAYGLWDGTDPCAGSAPSQTLAECARSGVTPAQYGKVPESPAGQYNGIFGAPSFTIQPETAKTYTLGAVWAPTASTLATVDYWSYKVDNVINFINPQFIVTTCVTSGQFCNFVHRGPNGNLWVPNSGYIEALNRNLGFYKASGMDFTFNWSMPIENWGSVGINFGGTWYQKFDIEQVPGYGTYDCAGLYGPTCGTPVPKWKHRLMGTWNTPWSNITAALTWRYIDSVDFDLNQSNPLLAGLHGSADNSISAQSYFDLALQWAYNKNITVRAGVNNIFDKDPPVLSSTANTSVSPPIPNANGPSSFGNGGTWPQVYDALGRTIFFSVTAKF